MSSTAEADRTRREQRQHFLPFGLADMHAADAAQSTKIDAAVERLRNVADAVADLALAESVHQALKGKPDIAAANLDAQGSALFPPVSEFVATPREGIAITSRTAIFLDPAPPPALAGTRRRKARAAPQSRCSTTGSARCSCGRRRVRTVHNDTTGSDSDFSLTDLGRQPIDWLYDLKLDDRQALASLDQAVEEHYRRTQAPVGPRDKVTITLCRGSGGQAKPVRIRAAGGGRRQLVSRGRELRASDIALSNDSNAEREGGAPDLPLGPAPTRRWLRSIRWRRTRRRSSRHSIPTSPMSWRTRARSVQALARD